MAGPAPAGRQLERTSTMNWGVSPFAMPPGGVWEAHTQPSLFWQEEGHSGKGGEKGKGGRCVWPGVVVKCYTHRSSAHRWQ